MAMKKKDKARDASFVAFEEDGPAEGREAAGVTYCGEEVGLAEAAEVSGSAARQLARVRKIARALPEVSERPSHGAPTWFAGKKVFVTFWNDHHGDGHVAALVPAPPGVQEQLIAQDARTYYRPPYVGVKGWVGIEVARVSDETLRFHVETAWEMVAPKKVLRAIAAPAKKQSVRRKSAKKRSPRAAPTSRS